MERLSREPARGCGKYSQSRSVKEFKSCRQQLSEQFRLQSAAANPASASRIEEPIYLTGLSTSIHTYVDYWSHLIEEGVEAVYPLLELAEPVVGTLSFQGEGVDNLPFFASDKSETNAYCTVRSESRKQESARARQRLR